jgi:lipoyl(octanoyl) transferase
MFSKTDQLSQQYQIKNFGIVEYQPVFDQMRQFTDNRNQDTLDEFWVLEHFPVYTLGLAGKREHLLSPNAIPVIKIDRGGQVTYHGQGQVVIYVLVNLRRKNYKVKQFVNLLEQSMIELLSEYGIESYSKKEAPGVYVGEKKIGALGLRIRKGCSYHGLSLNVDMDLSPFNDINPCGHPDLGVTQLADLTSSKSIGEVKIDMLRHLTAILGYY